MKTPNDIIQAFQEKWDGRDAELAGAMEDFFDDIKESVAWDRSAYPI